MPLDMETIVGSLRKTHRLVVCHQAPKTGGFGAELSARVQELAFNELDAPVERVAGLDTPAPYNVALERVAMVYEKDIIEGVRRALA